MHRPDSTIYISNDLFLRVRADYSQNKGCITQLWVDQIQGHCGMKIVPKPSAYSYCYRHSNSVTPQATIAASTLIKPLNS